ncbi:MFS transporter [Megalodesulfovibrio paquesii]
MHKSNKWAVLFAVVVTQFAVPFMISGVGVCLPAIGREFSASAIALSLVEAVFLCGNAMLLLPLGRAADILGRGAVFLTGLALFTLTTLGLTLAPTMEWFLAIRGVQAAGGAMTLATGLALLYDAFPPEERGKALGISMAGIFLGISAGPFLGGLIVAQLGWRWLFYAGMLPSLVAVGVCLRNLDWKIHPKAGERFDWPGAISSALAIGLFVFGSAHTEEASGWWGMGAGAALFVVFLLIESRSSAPLLHLDLFLANRQFSFGIASIFTVSGAAFAVPFLLSLHLQIGRGMTPAAAGMLLVIQPVVQSLVSPVVGRLADKLSPRLLAGAGSLLTATGVCLASQVSLGSSLEYVGLALGVVGLGIGMFSSPSMVVVMSAVTPARYGIASALTGQARTLGMTLCMSAVTVVIAHHVGDRPLGPEVMSQYQLAMKALLAGFGILGLAGSALCFAARQRAGASLVLQASPPEMEQTGESACPQHFE